MLRITAKLKQHLVENFSLKSDATESDARSLIAEKMVSGELSLKTIEQLTTDEASEAEKKIASLVEKAVSPIADRFEKAIAALSQSAGHSQETGQANLDETKEADRRELVTKMASLYGISESEAEAKLPATSAGKAYGTAGQAGASNDDQSHRVRVKSVVEQFSHTPTAAMWDHSEYGGLCQKSGKVLPKEMPRNISSGSGDASRDLNMPTERTKAIAGAWFKHLIVKAHKAAGRPVRADRQLTELDRRLIEYAIHECKFVGPIGFTGNPDVIDEGGALAWGDGMRLADISSKNFDLLKKSLLDDSTSGGLEAVPIEFDDNFILTPLLEGELFPLVNLRTVSRRRIEATSFGNLTMSWGTSEGTQISLFNTDSFISAFDTTIYPVTGAVEVGLDFLADSPLNVGSVLVSEYGKAFRKEMDDVIADGNGTNRPEGIFQASGFTSVSSAGGAGTAPQVGDYESLYFSIPKQYRNEAGARFIYLSTDTSYRRARGIAVNSSSDARRVFGMDQKSYTIFDNPYRVTGASGVTNAEIAGVMINRYRMYRRQGLEVRVVTEDAQLARSNSQLIVVRARFGGQMEKGAAIAKITDGQA